jgi:phenylalanyl-tRNA synthetase alpha chain
MPAYLSSEQLSSSLALRDLTDPRQGSHAIQLILDATVDALRVEWSVPVRWVRTSPLVSVKDNYDKLGFSPEAVTRDARYSRYVSPTVMLRSHTSAAMPWILAAIDPGSDIDELLVLPGLAYRRDSIDRTHVGEPHQVDLWRVSSRAPRLTGGDLERMLGVLVQAVLPGARWRALPATHPYTAEGRQLDVLVDDEWLELAECGLISPALLRESGLDPERWSGLALGMGLDRALMLRKGIDDIRVLRSENARAQAQMTDLAPWQPVSSLPPITRDISIVIAADQDDETIGDRIRASVPDRIDDIETVSVLARTEYEELPARARDRLGIRPHQVNALVRIVMRPIAATLTDGEANELRDRIYLAVHEGPNPELISSPIATAERGDRA